MKEIVVKTFSELHEHLESYEQRFTVFRGVADVRYGLMPRIGRPETRLLRKPRKTEQEMVKLFQERAIPHLIHFPKNPWEWLALMQHHGVPTRLMDWSRNPLVAAYFAVEDSGETDSAIYAWRNKEGTVDIDSEKDLFKISEVLKFIPPHLSHRIIAQAGLFTVHPAPFYSMKSPAIKKIIIPRYLRKPIKDTLFKYGIHRASLFPDLDDLASHITWMNVDSH